MYDFCFDTATTVLTRGNMRQVGCKSPWCCMGSGEKASIFLFAFGATSNQRSS